MNGAAGIQEATGAQFGKLRIPGTKGNLPGFNISEESQGLRVAHISVAHGGAAVAAKRLHVGLRRIGIDSRFFVIGSSEGNRASEHIYELGPSTKVLGWADVVATLINNRLGLFGMLHLSSLFWTFPNFDVIHLHGPDTLGFNLYALYRLNRKHVLVYTMHDKMFGTGGCGYPERWDCERWRIGCGQCPKAAEKGWLIDGTHFLYERKKRIINSTQVAIVAPSRWMFDFIRSNPLTLQKTARLIANGVDTKTFAPLPSAQCRAEVGLPASGRLLLSVASRWSDTRKGVQFYSSIMGHLKACSNEKIAIIFVGDPPPKDTLDEIRALSPVIVLGRIAKIETLAKIYSSVDFFVITSIIDNLPNVVLESLACGTPVAGFKVGGIPDLIMPGESGVLADVGDTKSLALQIGSLLADGARLTKMGASGFRMGSLKG